VELTIPAALVHAAREYGDAAALAEPGGPRLSYRELHEQVITVARALIAEGMQPGERVAIWSPNTHHWVVGALGVLYAGATLVPVSTRFTGHEALDVISRSGARGLIVAGPFLGTDRLAALRGACPGGERSAPRGRGHARQAAARGQRAHRGRGWLRGAAGWDDFTGRAAAVPAAVAADRASAVGPDDVSDILFTSGTPGGARAR